MIDETHDPSATSWVEGANAHPDFPVQNLPFGMFSTGDGSARAGVAIGDFVLDLAKVAGLLEASTGPALEAAASGPALNALFSLQPADRRSLRRAIFALLADPAQHRQVRPALVPASAARMHLPIVVRDFTDFYAGIHHARTVGSILRPENPLLPNYKYVPVGYHGRASSVRVSPATVIRPNGQLRPAGQETPSLGPSRRLDYEVELGFWIGGTSQLGEPVSISDAGQRMAGVCLLNDWSARDIQAWEYQPLGPFLAKNFATTISPWIVTAEALAPFRIAQPARPQGDPEPLDYLLDAEDQAQGALAVTVEVELRSQAMRLAGTRPMRLGSSHARDLYWTPAQLIAHHSVNGCDLAAGDLMGTGTISGPDEDSRGSLMELSLGGTRPVGLPDGEQRTFLEDGDEVIFTGKAERAGFRSIGFGECRATIAGSDAA